VCYAGSGLFDELITCLEESYRVFVYVSNCVCLCPINLNNEAVWARAGSLSHRYEILLALSIFVMFHVFVFSLLCWLFAHIAVFYPLFVLKVTCLSVCYSLANSEQQVKYQFNVHISVDKEL
jgi:hypothetical protein